MNRPDDFHVRGSPTLQAFQLVTVKCDVLIRFDPIAAKNFRSADRLLIARRDQRLSEASDRGVEEALFAAAPLSAVPLRSEENAVQI